MPKINGMARGGRIGSTIRRIAQVALEDFGLRPPPPLPPPAPPLLSPAPPAPPPPTHPPEPAVLDPPDEELPPGVVWRGSATRSPSLQRFCDDLEDRRNAERLR